MNTKIKQIFNFNYIKKLLLTTLLVIISVFLFLHIVLRVFETNQNDKLTTKFHPRQVHIDLFDPNVILPQDNSLILNELLQYHIVPPPTLGSRKLSKKIFVPTSESDILKIFKGKKNGFFIECGANDGEFYSNTLGLEVNYNWTGLLVEASPRWFAKLKNVKRNAWITNLCLSAKPEKVEFIICNGTGANKQLGWSQGQGKVKPDRGAKKSKSCNGDEFTTETVVNCFPLYSILSAINVTYVDYFSLDVEGHEYKILKAIPFDKVFIKVIHVEYWWTPEGKQAISDLLVSNGYKMIYDYPDGGHEFIFIKEY